MSTITACLDANVYISAIAFHGKPLEILQRALRREFLLVTGSNILQEVRRNLIGKLGLSQDRVQQFIVDIAEVSSMYTPSGNVQYIDHRSDNLVLELAIMGGCDVLVTGDRRHLLPLQAFQGLIIESPSNFLQRLDGRF